MSEATVMFDAAPREPPGWYGKLPSLGDFASRRLPDTFIQPWDDWLQRGLASGFEALGDDWLLHYLITPIRRFWLAPGLLGTTAWAGLLMPSVDRVGRHFPLSFAAPVSGGADGLAQAIAAHEWYVRLDDCARLVLDVNYEVDELEAELARLAPWPSAALEAGDAAACVAQTLLARQRRHNDPKVRSVWWHDDAAEAAQFECYESLPPPAAFVSWLGAPRAWP